MAAYYYDSGNSADGSRDGSQGHPFLDPSELPTPSRITDAQSEHYFKRGTTTNLDATLRSTALTSVPIVIGAWGDGARPIITAYRLLEASECVECDVDNSADVAVLTIPPAGGAGSSNLWRVPKTFFGLFDGDVWGGACDVAGLETGTKTMPAAAMEWCGAVADPDAISGSYGVIYSVGNPVTTYGGVYASSFSEGTWGSNANERVAIGTLLGLGGVEISGLDFQKMYFVSRAHTGSVPSTAYDLALHSIHDCRVSEVFRGFNMNIGAANAPNVTHASIRVYDNYGENLGSSLFDTAGTLYSTLNDTRIYRNVINGFCKSFGTGAIYMGGGVQTSDGLRILVEENTASYGEGGHYWLTDGYAFYQEREGRDIEFRRNFAWNCPLNYIALWGRGNVVFSNNVGIAGTGDYAPFSEAINQFITIQSAGGGEDHPDHRVRAYGNVAVGFRSFTKITTATTDSAYEIISNISLRGGNTRAAVYADFVAYDSTRLTVDGNNFYDHSHQLTCDPPDPDPTINYSNSPEITNKITSDPSTELARLPTPTDPTVNYALQIRPGARIVNGTVDLRPGTRVVA